MTSAMRRQQSAKIRAEFHEIRQRVRRRLGIAFALVVPVLCLPGLVFVWWFFRGINPAAYLVWPAIVVMGFDRATKPYLEREWRCPACHCYLDRLHPFVARAGWNYCPYCSSRLWD